MKKKMIGHWQGKLFVDTFWKDGKKYIGREEKEEGLFLCQWNLSMGKITGKQFVFVYF